MHAHRILMALALALASAAAAHAAVEMPASPKFDAPRADTAVRDIATSERRFAAARSQASHRTPQRPQLRLPEPPLGALVFAGIGAMVLLRGRRIDRP